MPQFLSPDVFETEVQGKSTAVPPAGTSALAMAGYSLRGAEDKPLVCTSFADFVRQFGSFSKKSFNTYSAAAYFNNGGNQLWFVRKLHADAVAATGQLGSADNFLVKAAGRGVWANQGEVTLTGEDAYYDPSTATYSRFSLAIEIVDQITGSLSLEESYDYLVLDDVNDPNYILSIVNNESSDIIMSAVSGGIPTELKPVAFNTLIATGDGATTSFSASLAVPTALAPGLLSVAVSGVVAAVDDGLGNLIAVSGGPSVSGTVNYATGAMAIYIGTAPVAGAEVKVSGKNIPQSSITAILTGGADGSAVIASDITSQALQATKQGIYALDDVDVQLSLCLPDFVGDVSTDLALITYAEGRRDVLAILTPALGTTPQSAVAYRRNTLKSQSSYACMVYPWVKVSDPLNSGYAKLVPAVAHFAGRCAYTDINGNVGLAPAGITRGQMQGIIGVERTLSKNERDILYPAQINPIRSDANVGTAFWGNKTLQIVGDFTDVNIRRTFINLEKEQYQVLLNYNFENIGPATFNVIATTLSLYLEQKYLLGVIGSGVSDMSKAFKVICDETNNTTATQASKIIIIDEFIKPDVAAEYIWLRLQRVNDASQV